MPRNWQALPFVLLLCGVHAGARGGVSPPETARLAARKVWVHLRDLVTALATDGGTHNVFYQNPALGERFNSADTFSGFVQPWRSRLVKLPSDQMEARGLDLDVDRIDDGTTVCRMTFYHSDEARTFTIMKTVWRGERLLKLDFVQGFIQIYGKDSRWNTNP